jgi:hypothetical protein
VPNKHYILRRTLKDLDVSRAEDKQRVFDMLGGGVLNDLSVRMVVDGDIEEDSPVEQFVKELKERSSLHYYAAGA